MKNQFYLFLVAAVLMLISGFSKAEINDEEGFKSYEVPENIATIIDQSCIMCHNADSDNKKGKMKFRFDKMSELKLSKQISKLSKIANEVEKGDMPPEKFLKHNLDKALTKADEEVLIDWARSYAKELSE